MCNEHIQNTEKLPFPPKSLSAGLCLIFHVLEFSCVLIPLAASSREVYIFAHTVFPVKVLIKYICINWHFYILLYETAQTNIL